MRESPAGRSCRARDAAGAFRHPISHVKRRGARCRGGLCNPDRLARISGDEDGDALDRPADLTNAFEAAGIERKAAEHLAAEIFDAIRETVATKADLAEMRAAVNSDIAELRAAVNSDITKVRAELRETELRLEGRLDRLVARIGSVIVVIAGLLFAALHYWPPHG